MCQQITFYPLRSITNFLKERGYQFANTVNSNDVYSKEGYPDIIVPDLIVMDIDRVKTSVLTDSVMFVEFINQI